MVKSPRPFVIDHMQPLIHAATDNGFPPDHVLWLATIAFVVFTHNKKLGIILCALTLLVGVGRVLAFARHPIDVVGSLIISFVAAGVGYFFIQFFSVSQKAKYSSS